MADSNQSGALAAGTGEEADVVRNEETTVAAEAKAAADAAKEENAEAAKAPVLQLQGEVSGKESTTDEAQQGVADAEAAAAEPNRTQKKI